MWAFDLIELDGKSIEAGIARALKNHFNPRLE
jgi:hypothetical protein